MTEHVDYEKMLHNRAVSTMKAHGILSIIFGALGTVLGLGFALIVLIMGAVASYDPAEVAGAIIYTIAVFVFWILPHIFFIVSGAYLVRNPTPKIAKGLVITNLVVGVFWNLVILIMAIINLTQMFDYERGYKAVK